MTIVPSQKSGPPEPDLTPDDMVERAQRIGADLVDRQLQTEERTFYAADTHEAFKEAGFYRILVPRCFGGYEFGIDTFVKVGQAISRGCGSSGWMFTLGTSHALTVATIFPFDTQEELFADGDFICPTTLNPQGTASRVDGGWRISGVYNYCSGAPYGTHYMGHARPATPADGAKPMVFIAPRECWTRLDDWGDQLGMRGSGSHSIAFDNAFVPDRFVIENRSLVAFKHENVHSNRMYSGGTQSFFQLEVAAVSTGIARAALDEYESMMTTKRIAIPPFALRTDDADYQLWYGEIVGQIEAADAALMQCCELWHKTAELGFTREDDMRFASLAREIFYRTWEAELLLFKTAGSSAAKSGTRSERCWRDLSMMYSHTGRIFSSMSAVRQFTKDRFGEAHSPSTPISELQTRVT